MELIFDPIGSSKDDGRLKHWHTGLSGHHRLQRDGRLKTIGTRDLDELYYGEVPTTVFGFLVSFR